MAAANPVTGTTKQMKGQGRPGYLRDGRNGCAGIRCASPVIQDAIDLAYLTAQRPADVLKMRWDQVKDGALWVKQGKTKARLQIDVVGELSQLFDRIKSRSGSSSGIFEPRAHPTWESMSKARKWLGHSTESMTTEYVRARVGEKVSPVLISGYAKREKA